MLHSITLVERLIKYLELLDVLNSSEFLILVAGFTIPLQEKRYYSYMYMRGFVVVRLT